MFFLPVSFFDWKYDETDGASSSSAFSLCLSKSKQNNLYNWSQSVLLSKFLKLLILNNFARLILWINFRNHTCFST